MNYELFVQFLWKYSKEMKKMKGTVKWYNPRRGYGFIEGESEEDVFVHRTSIPDGVFLYEGDEVEFEIEESEKGPKAVNIVKL